MGKNKTWATVLKVLKCLGAICDITLFVLLLIDRKNASTKKTDERSVTE